MYNFFKGLLGFNKRKLSGSVDGFVKPIEEAPSLAIDPVQAVKGTRHRTMRLRHVNALGVKGNQRVMLAHQIRRKKKMMQQASDGLQSVEKQLMYAVTKPSSSRFSKTNDPLFHLMYEVFGDGKDAKATVFTIGTSNGIAGLAVDIGFVAKIEQIKPINDIKQPDAQSPTIENTVRTFLSNKKQTEPSIFF